MLLLPKGQTSETWEPPQNNALEGLGVIGQKCKVKGKLHPRTGHEGPDGE